MKQLRRNFNYLLKWFSDWETMMHDRTRSHWQCHVEASSEFVDPIGRMLSRSANASIKIFENNFICHIAIGGIQAHKSGPNGKAMLKL